MEVTPDLNKDNLDIAANEFSMCQQQEKPLKSSYMALSVIWWHTDYTWLNIYHPYEETKSQKSNTLSQDHENGKYWVWIRTQPFS